MSSFWKGFCSLFDWLSFRHSRRRFETDAEALQHDWEMVLGDYRRVISMPEMSDEVEGGHKRLIEPLPEALMERLRAGAHSDGDSKQDDEWPEIIEPVEPR